MIRISTEDQLKQEQKHERNFIAYIITALLVIILLFLLNMSLGYIEHKPLIPTGNVDIFDIIFKKDCDNECNCNNGGNPNKGSSGSPSEDSVEVFDEQIEYSQNTKLHIFTNTAYYVVNNKIAPSSSNSYQFVIRNNNEFNIKYDLDLLEENKYNINMKYRLKLNGVYVAGSDDEWLTYDELKQENIGLAANTYDVYALDWKWFEGSNDTEVGTNIDSNYKLELKITASGY